MPMIMPTAATPQVHVMIMPQSEEEQQIESYTKRGHDEHKLPIDLLRVRQPLDGLHHQPPVIIQTMRMETSAPMVSARWYPNEYLASALVSIRRMQYTDTTKERTSENM